MTGVDNVKGLANLNPNKLHDKENISICMLNIFADTIFRPLEIIFRQCFKTAVFFVNMKKDNLAPIYEKVNKHYCLVSFLMICRKVLERFMFSEMFRFFLENNLINSKKSGCKIGESSINHFLSISHDIYQSVDGSFEVHRSFLRYGTGESCSSNEIEYPENF